MDPFEVAQSFVELSQNTHSPASWMTAGFAKAIDALAFRHWALYSHVDPLHPPGHAIVLHNYPAAWVQRYSAEKLYEIDPVLRRAEREPLPFFWDPVFQAERMTVPQRTLLAEAAILGIADGYTVPIHLSWIPGALRASCTVIPTGHVDTRSYFLVQVMATRLYSALTFIRAAPRQTISVELSRRERQCLSLAALGKDDWAIGQLLGLSPDTVHSYFKRLMQRLDVRTRVQAIIWALETGQISFGDVPPGRAGPISSNGVEH
jgi:DNA-binding CsgD family transcriptional regulator